jgi:serine protease Do
MKRYAILALAASLMILAAISIAAAGSRSAAWLGVYTQEVDKDLAEAFDLAVDRGAIINEIVEDSPAEEAGLEEDDIIVKFDGDRVRDDEDLIDLVADADPGDEVELTVVRDGKEQNIQVELGRRPRNLGWHGGWDWFDAPRAPRAPRAPAVPRIPSIPHIPRIHSFHFDDFDDFDERAYIGVSLLEISERTADNLGAGGSGVMIDDVELDSPAEEAGLEPGDIIVAVDGEEVFEAEDVQDIIWSMDEGDVAKIEIVRERNRSTVEVAVDIDDSRHYYGGHRILRLPDMPDIDIDLPRMRGLRHGHSSDFDYFDSEEFQDEMEELEDELKEMKDELRELRKALE